MGVRSNRLLSHRCPPQSLLFSSLLRCLYPSGPPDFSVRRVKLSCLSDPLFLPLAKRNWNYGFTGQSVGWLLRQVDYLHRFLFTSLSTFQFTTRPLTTVPATLPFQVGRASTSNYLQALPSLASSALIGIDIPLAARNAVQSAHEDHGPDSALDRSDHLLRQQWREEHLQFPLSTPGPSRPLRIGKMP